MNLDKIQRKIVESDKEKIVVIASSGSGKTRVLTERINYLLENNNNPSNIYAITFTNAAAEEMESRLTSNKVFVGTIHSLANKILMANNIDTSDIIAREAFDELLEYFFDDESLSWDFQLPTIDYLLLDEAHDISKKEYRFIFSVLCPENFFIVCDTKQAIYGFRGSNFKQMNKLMKRKDITVYEMNHNYRCGRAIVDFANEFIEDMPDVFHQDITTEEESGYVHYLPSFNWERIKSYINNPSYGNYGDWFILCRTNAQIDSISFLLNKENIPNITFKKGGLSLDQLNSKINTNAIKVLTIHTSKGLENKNVIVIGGRLFNDEERRICYVAATRAKKNLIWIEREANLENFTVVNSNGWEFI